MWDVARQLQAWFSHPDRDRLLWPLVVGTVVCYGLFFLREAELKRRATHPDGEIRIPDVRWGYTETQIRMLLDNWGERGRAWYGLTQWTLDAVFPVCYGMLMAVGIARLGVTHGGSVLFLIPLAAVILDWLENGILATVALSNGQLAMSLVPGASLATQAKLVCIALSLLVLLYFGLSSFFSRPGSPAPQG